MTKLHYSAVRILDQIIRNVREEIENTANRFAEERGDDEATPDDITDAATVVFESDHTPLIRTRP